MSQNEPTLISDPKAIFDASEPKYLFAKADLKLGEKKYYEITAVQVDQVYLDTHGDKVITKEQSDGQTVVLTDWVVTKAEADGSHQQWTLYDETSSQAQAGAAYFQQRWKPVADKPGYYSPISVPTQMVELPEGGKVQTSWGTPGGGPGSFLAEYGTNDYNIITPTDLVNLGYTGGDEASRKRLAELSAGK